MIKFPTLDDALDYLRTLAHADQACGWPVTPAGDWATTKKTVTKAEDDDGEAFTITRTVTRGLTRGVWCLTERYS